MRCMNLCIQTVFPIELKFTINLLTPRRLFQTHLIGGLVANVTISRIRKKKIILLYLSFICICNTPAAWSPKWKKLSTIGHNIKQALLLNSAKVVYMTSTKADNRPLKCTLPITGHNNEVKHLQMNNFTAVMFQLFIHPLISFGSLQHIQV